MVKMKQKPLGEWTAKEIADECNNVPDCEYCCFSHGNATCEFCSSETPGDWNLDFLPPRRFSRVEVDMAKALKQASPKHEIIARESENELYINDNGLTDRGRIAIDPRCFPSIGVGEEYTLDEIISSEDEDEM
jgi:hypothetical protein